MITPPVALAALAASALCGAPVWDVGLMACYLGIGTLVTPFAVIWRPALTVVGFTPLQVIEAAYACILGVVCLSTAAQGYFLRPLSWIERLVLVVTSGLLLAPRWQSDLVGTAVLVSMLFWQARTRTAHNGLQAT